MSQITQNDWMDTFINGIPPTSTENPIKTLKSIPWARHKLVLVTLLSSLLGMIGVYYTESTFVYALCLVFVAIVNSAMFVTLFGARPQEPEPEPKLTAEQQKVYNERIAELKAEADFADKKIEKDIPRRLF